MVKCFYKNFFNFAKFHEKTASRSVDIKSIFPVGNGCLHFPILPFMDERNGEVRNRASYNNFELLKSVKILQVEIFWVSILLE